MDKLIKWLKDWHFSEKEPITLNKWFRAVLFDHITEKIKSNQKYNKWRNKE